MVLEITFAVIQDCPIYAYVIFVDSFSCCKKIFLFSLTLQLIQMVPVIWLADCLLICMKRYLLHLSVVYLHPSSNLVYLDSKELNCNLCCIKNAWSSMWPWGKESFSERCKKKKNGCSKRVKSTGSIVRNNSNLELMHLRSSCCLLVYRIAHLEKKNGSP